MSFRKKDKFQRGNYKKAGKSNSGDNDYSSRKLSTAEKEKYVRDKHTAAMALDQKFGYELLKSGPARLGWLFNMVPTTVDHEGVSLQAMNLYFLEQDAKTFKACYIYEPYFYVAISDPRYAIECGSMICRRFESVHIKVEVADKEDLELINHLAGHQRKYLKLTFNNVNDLMEVRKGLQSFIESNKAMEKSSNYNRSGAGASKKDIGIHGGFVKAHGAAEAGPEDVMELLVDFREYDVPYSMRASIDLHLHCGSWYVVHPPEGSNTDSTVEGKANTSKVHPKSCSVEWQKDLMVKAEPRVLAFDIECTKEPLKFPQAERDTIFMISYMVDTQGYLIISRDVVGEDVEDFEYTPKPGMEGPFIVFNELNEEALIRRFFAHVQEVRPQIFVTYNGDFFDWPFVEKRAAVYNMKMQTEIGVGETREGGYRGQCSVHLDCMAWVNRDSYLPQGSRGLKAVAKAKLGYDPVEVDPEDMVKFARENPKHMAGYSVSDAVATYYLYMKYIHDFIFALATIIPLGPEDVLNKGSGTLCESLLMIEAFNQNIICPNKQVDELTSFHEGHLLDTETYVGGHVEALETGVYREDLNYHFKVDPATVQKLIDSIDKDLTFALEVECGMDRSTISNYEQVRGDIIEKLEMLRDSPERFEQPLIYHLDVAAMYPNIILTNRLQPSSMVTQQDCAGCDFNVKGSNCQRPMEWVWRGDYSPASLSEYTSIKTQLTYEQVEGKAFADLHPAEQAKRVKDRLKIYSQKVYKKSKTTKQQMRENVVCMREQPFYVDTVRAFRDRRYDFKKLTKVWKNNKSKALKGGEVIAAREASDKETLYDSLQLAHKCILNSFYGYVMRKGARWRSMEMAGIVTHTGAELIKQARELVENLGRPLELDTDGIWCILPKSFPEDFTFKTHDGGKEKISYPCVMLNAQVHDKFTNEQYQDLKDEVRRTYTTKSECSIFFEVDGPYRAMILPASTEEGKLLKKRYAVFEMDGSLAELKGFEMKRRGELELIKSFQEQVFEQFLNGDSLASCYDSVAQVANTWLDVLDTRGEQIDDTELIELISENKTISGLVTDYGDQKITSLTTAARLGQYLGAEMLQDKGLNCRLLIANRPYGAPVTERAIPTVIFKADHITQQFWLRKWLKAPTQSVDLRDVIDWEYYRDRLGKTIMKIITIPAALQGVENPVPRVAHPDWLKRKVKEENAKHEQQKINAIFKKLPAGSIMPTAPPMLGDMEDSFLSKQASSGMGRSVVMKGKKASAASRSLEPTGPCPDRNEDFEGWLLHRKREWRELRKRRKDEANKRIRDQSLAAYPDSRATIGVADVVAHASRSMLYSQWQVLEAHQADAGNFVIWAITGARQIQRIIIEVPKVFYLNMTTEKEAHLMPSLPGGSTKKVKKCLPRATDSLHLYEVVTLERRFKRYSVDNILGQENVQGVFESRTPTWFRVLLELGCVCEVNEGRRKLEKEHSDKKASFSMKQRQQAAYRNLKELPPLSLKDMKLVPAAYQRYLHPNNSQFKRIFLYHSHAQVGNKDRSITALFFIDAIESELFDQKSIPSANVKFPAARAAVWISMKNKEGLPSMSRLLKKAVQSNVGVSSVPVEFSMNYSKSIVDTWKKVGDALSSYLREKKGATVVYCQTPFTVGELRRKCGPLATDFPCIALPHNRRDCEDQIYPHLQWTQKCADMAIQRYLQFPFIVHARVLRSRYSDIPIGNLGNDAAMMMVDVFLGRMIQNNAMILWASESGHPDLGGKEEDENDLWCDDDSMEPFVQPGAYRSYCVELDIMNLCVNAIATSAQLDALDGTQGVSALDTNLTSKTNSDLFGNDVEGGAVQRSSAIGDGAASATSFRVLKALVSKWLADASSSTQSNELADELLNHLHRYLLAPEALLFDPALKRVIVQQMRKIFMRLIGEFKRLGATVVFADFRRIIISTDKHDMGSATDYVSYITDTITAHSVFEYIRIEPTKCWESLLFLDEANYGGIEFVKPPSADSMVDDVEGVTVNHSELGEGKHRLVSQEEELTDAGKVDGDDGDDEDDDDILSAKKRQTNKHRFSQHIEEDSDESGGEEDHPLNDEVGEAEEVEQEIEGDGEEETTHVFDSQWNIADYLPDTVREYFEHAVYMFLHKPWEEAQMLRSTHEARIEQQVHGLSQATMAPVEGISQHELLTQTILRVDEDEASQMEQYMKSLVNKTLTRFMLRSVEQIRHNQLELDKFPVRAGSFRDDLTNVELELVKAVCRVLSLQYSVGEEVQKLRRILLTQCGVREFAEEATFTELGLSFVLPDVICHFCSRSRDLDLCRDRSVMEKKLKCCDCDSPYDRDLLEMRLVEMLQRRSTKFQLQDVRCAKCKKVSNRVMGLHCSCSGKLICDDTPQDFKQYLLVMSKVGEYHEFEWLSEMVENLSF